MKKILITAMSLFFSIPGVSSAQDSQTMISLESRVGYSSNTYLNPFFAEWNPSLNSAYGMVSGFVQSSFYDKQNVLDLTGGAVVEPILNGRYAWKGALGMLSYKRKLSPEWSIGVEGGGSYFSGTYNRGSVWGQPFVTWFPTFFTSFTVKAGSSYQVYTDFIDGQDSGTRYDIYGMEFETWPAYNWKIGASLYGSMDVLPDLQEQFSSGLNLQYSLNNGSTIQLDARMEQYQFEGTTSTSGPGGPPIGGPPAGGGGTVITTNSDRIFRLGLTGTIPVNETFSVFATAEGLRRTNSQTGQSFSDFQVSGGVRMLIDPGFGRSDRRVSPVWEQNRQGHTHLEVHYSGAGRLYLVGDFNDWNRAGIALIEKSKNTYTVQLNLDAGAYEYKILHIEGNTKEWLNFSDDVYTVDDGFGGENGMLFIE